jgi:uncharacterized protein
MIAIDTNILVYAHRGGMPSHQRCRDAVEELVRSGRVFAIPWPCAHEFIGAVTHPRKFMPPTPSSLAASYLSDFIALPQCRFIGETEHHMEFLAGLLSEQPLVFGPRVHDARIAAICLAHGVTELWTADRDFSYFPRLRTRNPLVL